MDSMLSYNNIKSYTIVIPVYYNEGSIALTFDNIKEKVFTNNSKLIPEVIFVDDGSGDNSYNELLNLHKREPSIVKVIKLTRNFGQVSAIYAGLKYMSGNCAIVISADNQDPPELINDMLNAYFNEDYKIVICTREKRNESPYRKWTSKLFYSTMRKLSFPNMPVGGFDFVLLGKEVVNDLLKNREATPFFQGQIFWTGYKKKLIPYRRLQRETGKSRWSFGKKVTYMLDGVLSYSFAPIRLVSVIGLLVALGGFLYAILVFILGTFGVLPVKGWAPIMIVILILGGVQMIMIGIIGEYLWRIFAQVLNREPFVVETFHDQQ